MKRELSFVVVVLMQDEGFQCQPDRWWGEICSGAFFGRRNGSVALFREQLGRRLVLDTTADGERNDDRW
jgi:hypothetical protein